MRTDSTSNSIDVRVETALSIMHVGPDLFAYSLVRTGTVIRPSHSLPRIPESAADSATQGFVDGENRRALMTGDPHVDLPLLVATEEFLEGMRTGGFGWLAEEHFEPLKALRATGPFDALKADPTGAARIVQVDMNAHALLDASGAPVPWALRFASATSPRFDCSRWDVHALADILERREDVIVLDPDGCVPEPAFARARDGIHAVPWEAGGNRMLAFLWQPDAAAFAEAWEHAAGMAGSRDPSEVVGRLHRAVVDADILGIAEARLDRAAAPRP